MAEKPDLRIGAAVAALRKRRGMTQHALAKQFGVGSAQIISTIEKGQRALKASEAARLASILSVPLSDLLSGPVTDDPFVLWRAEAEHDRVARADEQALFLLRCRRYAFVERLTDSGVASELPQFSLRLDKARFEDMEAWSNRVRNVLGLGDTPALQLRQALEEHAGIKVFVSPLRGGSGAATRGSFGAAILENSDEPSSRRVFSLAHELFHLLTWDSVAAREEELTENERERNEKLANAFGSALLMPESSVRQQVDSETSARPAWHRLLPVAAAFAVSPTALLFRMVNLKLTSKATAGELEAIRRERNDGGEPRQEQPLPRRFVLLAFRAWCDGNISLGKLAEILETTVGLLEPTLAEYGVDMENDAQEAAGLPA